MIYDEILLTRESSPYITKGLVLWLDGINNTRSGHDPSATKWEDLSGHNYDFTNGGGGGGWSSDHYHFNGSTGGAYFTRTETNNEFSAQNVKWVEICYHSTALNSAFLVCGNGAGIYHYMGALNVGSGTTVKKTGQFARSQTSSCVAFENMEAPSTCYLDGVLVNKSSDGSWGEASTTEDYIGSRPAGTYKGIFDLYAIRMYDHVLTEAEILKNYQADVARFNLGVTE